MSTEPPIMKMHQYYVEKKFNPTYAALSSHELVLSYLHKRRHLLQHRLFMPAGLFRDQSVLEFGPAGGENALVWAMLGAEVYLVEPVPAFHDTIRRYFSVNHQENKLKMLLPATLEAFTVDRLYDVVVAEGFIYTTGPASDWTRKLSSCVKNEGFVLLSICEMGGFLIELFQSRICRLVSGHLQMDEVETANMILGPKWRALEHSRSFDSWARDVLYHPCVNSDVLNHSGDIIAMMAELGMGLYSAWPSLGLSRDVTWIRQMTSRPEKVRQSQQAALHLLPSLMLGHTVAIDESVPLEHYSELLRSLREELKAISDWSYPFTAAYVHTIIAKHRRCEQLLDRVVINYPHSMLARLMREISQCLEVMIHAPGNVAQYFNPAQVLGSVWGSPNQYLVFQRTEA